MIKKNDKSNKKKKENITKKRTSETVKKTKKTVGKKTSSKKTSKKVSNKTTNYKLNKIKHSNAKGVVFNKDSIIKKIQIKRDIINRYSDFYDLLSEEQQLAIGYYKLTYGSTILNYYLRTGKIKERFVYKIPSERVNELFPLWITLNESDLLRFRLFITPKSALKLYYNKVIKKSCDLLDSIYNKEGVPLIGDVMNDYKSNEFKYLYRSSYLDNTLDLEPGSIIKFDAYSSTSRHPEIPVRIYHDVLNPHYCLLKMNTNTMKNIPFIYIDFFGAQKKNLHNLDLNIYADRFEYLLPRGLKLKVTKIYRTTKYNKYIAEYQKNEIKQLIFDRIHDYKNKYDISKIDDKTIKRASFKKILDYDVKIIVVECDVVSCTFKPLPKYEDLENPIIVEESH